MFDLNGYKKYVGDKSGASYVSGLKSLEKILNISIDEEFQKDNGNSMLEQLSKMNKDKTLSETERKHASDMRSHLKRYIAFSMKKQFRAWFIQQPQKDNAEKNYELNTIDAAIRLLESGVPTLGINKYNRLNCFEIVSYIAFKSIYDKCYTLAEKYDKKNGHRDFENGLDYYLSFLKELFIHPIFDTINEMIKAYKEDFTARDKEERYKWQAVGTYKRGWNIDAPDFAPMLSAAFGETANLLRSGNYCPYERLIAFAEKEPETVRSLFKTLYDENLSFEKRCSRFQKGFNEYYKPQNLEHYQDLHAISVYLTCEYPEKYYIYEDSVVKELIKQIEFECDSIDTMSDAKKMELLLNLYDVVLEVVKQDDALQKMSMARLDETCYPDEDFHMLTHDIIYFSSKCKTDEIYWPTLEEYDPGVTVEMWKEILNDKSLTSDEMLDMLAKMLKIGGKSTCYHMAEVYGKTYSYYNAMGSNFGKRVKERYNLPDCYDSERNKVRYYTIPFVGRDIVEDGKIHYSWKLRDALKEALEEMDLTVSDNVVDKKGFDKNIILYGPPGTGKTYNTAIYAVAIIENKSLEEVSSEDYFDILERYHNYKKSGKIEFTTFHQSYGYEEFIEGIKPVITEKEDGHEEVVYEVLPGVFKGFCDKIEVPEIKGTIDMELNDYPTVWKVSLEGTGNNPTRSECLEHDHIRIGYDGCGEDATQAIANQEEGYSVLNRFINEMSVGDIVISCYTAYTIDAIGVVTGEYEWHDEYEDYRRLRKVKWLVKGIDENIVKMNNGKKLSNPTVHRVNITLNDVMEIVKKYSPEVIETENKGNYVFIIDEINRGNISKILGELITLIEPTKRKGQTEEMQAKLPYSQKEFGVPDNVYIIGTMNTADRSIAAIDTALRRRFSFREMLPQANVLEGIEVEGVSVSHMLEKMNRRIEVLYDREHTIGHAYFMPLQYDNSIDSLAAIFKDKIIPLLQEYFYEDYDKIRLVLGDNQKTEEPQFIVKEQVDETKLFGEDTDVIEDAYKYAINEKAFTTIEAYQKMI